MWPMLLDYSKEESKRILRRMELGAYASIVSVFRAQGDLSKDKKKILQDLQQTLSISTERHRAEVRRAINDEKLTTIADSVVGDINASEWLVEGRRLIPLMPRLVPQTAYTAPANQAASAMVEKNAALPPPAQTVNKNDSNAAVTKLPRSSSPSSNVVVLPSGTSIHIKGMLNQEEEEDLGVTPQYIGTRSLSTESQNAANVSTQTPRVSYSSSTSIPPSSPVKITISKSPQGRPTNVSSGSQPAKVILVTSASGTPGAPMTQRSTPVPMVRSVPTTASTHTGPGPLRNPVCLPETVHSVPSTAPPPSYPGVVTSTTMTSSVSLPVTVPTSSSSSTVGSAGGFNPSVQIGLGKVRPRIVPRQRYPNVMSGHKSGVVVPMGGPQLVSPSHHPAGQTLSVPQVVSSHHQPSPGPAQVLHHHTTSGGIQVKTLNKPTIQIKQEGGMKIITQSAANKILPKPSQMPGTGSSTPVVMVNTGQSASITTSAVTMLPRTISTYTAHSGGKVLNITTPGGRVIATTTKANSVVTVNPKTLHLTAVKSGSGSTTVSKPNVIVVQKTQHPRLHSPLVHGSAHIRSVSTSSFPGAIDKELIGTAGRHITSGVPGQPQAMSATLGRPGERRVIITTSGAGGESTKPVSIIHKNRSDNEGKTACLLTELFQATRHVNPSDTSGDNNGSSIYEIEGSENYMSTAVLTSLASLSSSSMSASPLPSSFPTYSSSSIFTPSNLPTHSIPLQQQQHPLHHCPQQQLPIHLPPPSQQQKLVDEGRTEIISTARTVRLKSDNDPLGEQTRSVEQAMSLLNREVVDLTDLESSPTATIVMSPVDTITAATANVVTTTTSIPTIVNTAIITNISTSVIPHVVNTIIPGLGQPKVSILGVSQKATGKVVALSQDKVKIKPACPVDVPREGHLDTQTGLFYPPVPPAITSTAASSSISSTSLLLPSSTTASSLLSTASTPLSSIVRIIDVESDNSHLQGGKPEFTVSLSSVPLSTPLSLSSSSSISSSSSFSAVPTTVSSHLFSQTSLPTTESNPYSPPLQVVQQPSSSQQPPSQPLPLPVSSSSLLSLSSSSSSSPPLPLTKTSSILSSSLLISTLSVLSSSSSSSPSLTSSSTVTMTNQSQSVKPTTAPHAQPPPLDILSSSLAHAGLNLDSFVQDNEGSDFDSSLTLTLEEDGEEVIEEEEEEGEEWRDSTTTTTKAHDGAVDQVESGPTSTSVSSNNAPRRGMAEVIREETAKDGTRIITINNPASSQLDHTPPPVTTFFNGQQQMVSLPSHPVRQASPLLSAIVTSTPTPASRVVTVAPPAFQDVGKMEKLLPVSPVVAKQHSTMKTANILPTPTTIPPTPPDGTVSVVPDTNFLSVTSPGDKSPRVITLRLDDLTTSHKLDLATGHLQNSGNDVVNHPDTDKGHREPMVEIPSVIAQLVEKSKEVVSLPNSYGDGTIITSVNSVTSSIPLTVPPSQVVISPVASTATTTMTIVTNASTASTGTDQTSPIRSSKRKRKHPSDSDSSYINTSSGWMKLASALLMKVCQFKGSSREKTDIPAAEWFTFPVDPLDAPDYYTVVHNPIDFSTMRKKLKDNQYTSFEDFDADMDLIKSNCFLYNSEGTKVRRDCEEVMAYYHSELGKMLEKQSKENSILVDSSPLKKLCVEDQSSNL